MNPMNDNDDLSLHTVRQNEIDKAHLLADALKRVANLKAALLVLDWHEIFRNPRMSDYLYQVDFVGPFAENLADALTSETKRLLREAEREVTARERDCLKAQKTLREVAEIVSARNKRNAKAS